MATHTLPTNASETMARVPFGKPMRGQFQFADSYIQLNHGSYGTYPRSVRAEREKLLDAYEARPDPYRRFVQPDLVIAARKALAPLLGADTDEVVFVTNATTGTNTILHNLAARWSANPDPAAPGKGDDAVLYFTTTYGACRKNLLSLQELGRLRPVEIVMAFPDDDDDALVAKLRSTHADAVRRGLKPRAVVIDTIVSGPGVLMPWERLVAACRDLGILSVIDGAHGIGQIDLTHIASEGVQPDFFVSNVHKWLFAPRGCAVLYVPFRNQHYITTSMPTSWEWELPADRVENKYFAHMFSDLGTADISPFLCVPAAIKFRNEVCGGEEAIREYCIGLAKEGGDRAAAILGTRVMDSPNSSMRKCNFANLLLPLETKPDAEIAAGDVATIPHSQLQKVADWIQRAGVDEYDTYLQVSAYRNQFWVRVSAMVYLDVSDFEFGARTLLALSERVKKGEWKK